MPFVFLTAASGNWTVPADCRVIDYIDCIGGGGSGAVGSGGSGNGGGGQGGGFSRRLALPVTPGAIIPYVVGMGGGALSFTGTGAIAGNPGGQTYFRDGATCWALGGLGGRTDGVPQGSNLGGFGDIKYSGGQSGNSAGQTWCGLGGGGAAGPNGPGSNGLLATASARGTAGGNGGSGAGGVGGASGTGVDAGPGGAGQEYATNVGSGGGGGGAGGVVGTLWGGFAGAWGAGSGGAYIQVGGGTAVSRAGYQGLIALFYTPYVPKPPTVLTLSEQSGGSSGGQTITVNGTNFDLPAPVVTAVKFGLVNATSFTIVSNTQLTAVTPPQPPGTVVTVTATNVDGTSGASPTNEFTYKPPAVGVNFAMMGM